MSYSFDWLTGYCFETILHNDGNWRYKKCLYFLPGCCRTALFTKKSHGHYHDYYGISFLQVSLVSYINYTSHYMEWAFISEISLLSAYFWHIKDRSRLWHYCGKCMRLYEITTAAATCWSLLRCWELLDTVPWHSQLCKCLQTEPFVELTHIYVNAIAAWTLVTHFPIAFTLFVRYIGINVFRPARQNAHYNSLGTLAVSWCLR